MKPLLLLALILTCSAADLEQITLADGRRLVGYYDEAAGKLTVEGPPKAILPVAPSQIASRSPYVRAAEVDPVKRDEAELVRLEAEHAKALGDVERLRKFASTRSGKDAETAIAQANEQADRATKLAEKIDETKARLTAAKPAVVRPVAVATPANPTEAWERSLRDAESLRAQYVNARYNATVEWLKTQSGPVLPPAPLSADPRQSEIDAHDRAVNETRKRQRLAKLLREAGSMETTDQRDEWVKDVLSVTGHR